MNIKDIELVENKDEFVYDLEVEDNHNYYAGGILISNCHNITSGNKISKIVHKIKTQNKYGFTGTLPESMIDKWSIIGKLGPVIYEKSSYELRLEDHLANVN